MEWVWVWVCMYVEIESAPPSSLRGTSLMCVLHDAMVRTRRLQERETGTWPIRTRQAGT